MLVYNAGIYSVMFIMYIYILCIFTNLMSTSLFTFHSLSSLVI